MRRINREEGARLWRNRIDVAKNVYRTHLWEIHHKLEEGLAGRFPMVMPPAATYTTATSGAPTTSIVNDQIEPNLLLWALNFMDGQIFDEFPALNWQTQPAEKQRVVTASESLVQMLLDQGDAMAEGRIALRYMMSRGMFAMMPMVRRATASPTEIRASGIDPSDYVMAARVGTLEEIPEGSDFFAIATALREELETPEKRLALKPEEISRMESWAQECEVEHQKALQKSHSKREGRIVYEALPPGSRFLLDPTTTEAKNADWQARLLLFDPDEFKEDPSFTTEAKDALEPVEAPPESDASLAAAVGAKESSDKALEETGKIRVWEVWDRKRWKRWYYADGSDKTIGVDETYPYLDAEGKPIFDDFFPTVIRVPMKHVRERSDTAYGIPYLWPGWGHQMEVIQFETAASRAAKRSARIGIAGDGMSEADVKAWTEATDGGVIFSKGNKSDAAFRALEMGPFPIEYLNAALRAKANFCSAVYLSLAALTGEPVADTLGQEEIAVSGGSMIRTGVMNTVASGIAELGLKSFKMFTAFASDSEYVGYLGKEAMDDVGGKPLWQAIKTSRLDGRKLTCTLASQARTAALAKNKQAMDFFAISSGPLGRDSTGILFFDAKSQLERLAKDMDIKGLVPYEASPAELIAAALTKAMGTQTGGGPPNNGAPSGGAQSGTPDNTSRTAGGGRGPQANPGAQSRGRGPNSNSNHTGLAMRPATAI